MATTAASAAPHALAKAAQAHAARGQGVESIVRKVVTESILNEANPCLELFSTNAYRARLTELRAAFARRMPSRARITHGLAVKAQPLRGILREARSMGFGAECASHPEAEPRTVIYDSPCKTYDELRDMIRKGVYINLDNEDEIAKVNRIARDEGIHPNNKQIGLRINPVVGGGTIASTSTATADSKFGLPWTEDTRRDLVKIYADNPWLQGVHVHTGSQGMALETLVDGVQRARDFAVRMRSRGHPMRVVDIGGGLPTRYDGMPEEACSFDEYAAALEASAPELFSGDYDLVTEFGRSVFVKPGITVTRVEAVKAWNGRRIAVCHVGANQLVRTAYLPDQWGHSLTVFGSDGTLKTGGLLEHDLAGPLCFSGDFVGRSVWLPEIEAGDAVVIHDTGGYTTSMYSRYNSRPSHAVYAYDDRTNELTLLKERETSEETLAFWGLADPVPL